MMIQQSLVFRKLFVWRVRKKYSSQTCKSWLKHKWDLINYNFFKKEKKFFSLILISDLTNFLVDRLLLLLSSTIEQSNESDKYQTRDWSYLKSHLSEYLLSSFRERKGGWVCHELINMRNERKNDNNLLRLSSIKMV